MDFKISCMNKYIHTELSRLFYSPLWSTERLGWPLQHCFPGGQQRHCLIKAGERSFTGDHAAAGSEYGLSPCGFCRLVALPRKITSSHSCGLVAFRVFFILTLCFEHDLLQLQNQQSCEVGPQARGESSKLLPSVKQNKTKKPHWSRSYWQSLLRMHCFLASCGLCNIAPGSPARWCDH